MLASRTNDCEIVFDIDNINTSISNNINTDININMNVNLGIFDAK